MIAPDMATMLAFVFTDLDADPATLHECLTASVTKSFNRITVDSDTSTSDTVLLVCYCDVRPKRRRSPGSRSVMRSTRSPWTSPSR